MRKFVLIEMLDPELFLPTVTLKQKHDDGSVTEIYSATLELQLKPKYTQEQLLKINSCNTVLAEKGMEPPTEEEIEYLLDPEGFKKRLSTLEKEMEDSETLQKLAGFRVEKKIVLLD